MRAWCRSGLVEAGRSLKELERVFITHLHSGHGLALGPLVHTVWTIGFDHPVTLYDPSGTCAIWAGFLASLAYDIETPSADEWRPDLAGLVHVIDYGPGVILPVGDLTAAALRVDHPPVTECFALKFIGAGKTVVFSADTAPFPPLADFACGAGVLRARGDVAGGVGEHRTADGKRQPTAGASSHLAQARCRRGSSAAADDPAFTEARWCTAVLPVFGGALVVGRDGLAISL